MSIKQQQEIKSLQERVDRLESIVNRLNDEPRKVAGVPDPDPKPAKKKAK